jgi:DNA repair exonuclease SbcCD ATPase subunit
MMKLSSITLVNWYLTNPIQLQIKGNTALVGANGAGKSSIIDAAQTVLFGGNQNYIKLNASSSDKKNDRDLKSYCLGTYDPQDDQDITNAFRLRDECYSYLGLTFENNKGEYVNLFIGMEARDSVKGVEIPLLGILRGKRSLSLSDFVENPGHHEFKVMDPSLIKQRFGLAKSVTVDQFEVAYFNKSKDYLEQMATSLGPNNPQHKIDPEALKRVLSKSISLKELSDISHFVDNFILESDPIDIGRLKSAQNSYEELSRQIEEATRKIEKLIEIKGHATRAIKGFKKSVSLRWIALEKEFEIQDRNAEGAYEKRKTDLFTALELSRKARKIKQQLKEQKKRIDELALQINEDDVQRRVDQLNLKLNDLTKSKESILKTQVHLYQSIKQLCSAEFSALEISEVDSLIQQLEGALEDIKSPTNRLNADKAINSFCGHLGIISKRVERKRVDLYPQIKSTENDIERIGSWIADAKSGKPSLSKKVRLLIEHLHEHGIQATPVCELVEVKDREWQYAIEALLGGNVEALIVHPDDEVMAFKLYRQFGKRNNFSGVNIVKTSKCETWINQYDAGSAAELINSDNRYALSFMHRKLGHCMLVETEQQLKQEKFAITKDGMLSTDTTVVRLDLSYTLKMIKDQSHNIALWEKQIKELRESCAQNKSALEAVEIISNRLVLTKSFFESGAAISFVEIEAQLDENEAKTKEVVALRDQIDLTHLHRLIEERDKLTGENDELSNNRDTAIREKGSYLSGAKHAKAKLNELLRKLDQIVLDRRAVEKERYYDASFTDELQDLHDAEFSIEDIRVRAGEFYSNAGKNQTDLNTRLEWYLEYEEDFIDREGGESREDDIEWILARIGREIEVIEKYNLVQYNKRAQDAKQAVQAAFRSDVVAKLKEKFESLKDQFRHLNRALRNKEFNSNTYEFTHQAKSEFKVLIDYINKATEVELDSVNSLFDSIPTEVLEEIEKVIELDNGNDYRKYFTYDVKITDITSGKVKRLSKLLGTGSGGEKQAPFYVAIASSLASAWKTINQSEGSAGVAMLDEAFNKLDENNLRNAIKFMNDAGIQVIVAAPTDKEQIFKTAVDTVLFVARDGQVVDIDTQVLTEKGWEILRQDNPTLNPQIIEEVMALAVA